MKVALTKLFIKERQIHKEKLTTTVKDKIQYHEATVGPVTWCVVYEDTSQEIPS